MKERLGIIFGILLILAVLILLSLATFRQRDETPDSELSPNRSSYNAGATGTLAFYTLLSETGRNVTRWREPAEALNSGKRSKVGTMIIIGQLRRPLSDSDLEHILLWVSAGGTLVLIDRQMPAALSDIQTAAGLSFTPTAVKLLENVDPYDVAQMTFRTPAARVVQPTQLVKDIYSVQPSRFAAGLSAEIPHPQPSNSSDFLTTVEPAIIHLGGQDKGILADINYGLGNIIILSDPFIVSNAGIGLADNSRLALQIASAGNGTIAFDEYHQGFGSEGNSFLKYFAGTPLPWIALQAAILLIILAYTVGMRFARPLDPPEPNRLARLEYISAMAELQRRMNAYDLALENIYGNLRRRIARLLGLENSAGSREQLAAMIASRTKCNRADIEKLFAHCEAIIHGSRAGKREVLEIVRELRRLENELGLSGRRRPFVK
ncbi:MAG: DUF4350 domain-containing protein [Acidobacteriota bacterium]